MNYSSKYKRWVERSVKSGRINSELDILSVYREVPFFQIKDSDDPLKPRYLSPYGRAGNIERLYEKIDQGLDNPKEELRKRVEKPASKMDKETKYYIKWQNCEMKLVEMRKKEERNLGKLKELSAALEEMQKSHKSLQEEARELLSQVEVLKKQLAAQKK